MKMDQYDDELTLTAIDLFSGGGGLSEGLKRAGVKIKAAVEIDPHAAGVYKANHCDVEMIIVDIRKVDFDAQKLNWGSVDIVSGCPPCQGFSSLTRKYHKQDPRNDLVLDFARAIKELRPQAVMMENVPGLATRGKPLLNEFIGLLADMGYIVTWEILQVADFGVPQLRRRLVLLAGLGFEIPFPEPTHSNKPKSGLPPWRTVEQAIKGMPKPISMKHVSRNGGPCANRWHVIREMTDINKCRLATVRAGETRIVMPESLRPDCHKEGYKGFSNAYTRMSWNEPSPTITGGCTTISKGRFGHPEELRTISVREAALLQTFPPGYDIATNYIDKACNVIGNALPCDFAQVLSQMCVNTIKSQRIAN